jgi:anti-anti-sigma factor
MSQPVLQPSAHTGNIHVDVVHRVAVVRLAGQFVGGDETDEARVVLESAGKGLIDGNTPSVINQVVVDMAEVTFVNSSFLGALLAAHASNKRYGILLVVAAVPETLEHLFSITKLDAVLQMYPSVDAALQQRNS